MKRKQEKIGDIYSIQLPNGQYAFAKLFKEFCLGIFKGIYTNYSDLPPHEDYQFFVGVYRDLLVDGKWEVVDHRPFTSEDDSWAPPQCIIDKISGKYSKYFKGKIIPSTKEECEGLEQAAAWDRHHVIDRIMGDQKWNPS